jgi:hypothetical protein
VWVFDFGAVVLWGVPRAEEAPLLKAIRQFVPRGMVGREEFDAGEDDLAFVANDIESTISIVNDVIQLPTNAQPKQRLSVSYAIGAPHFCLFPEFPYSPKQIPYSPKQIPYIPTLQTFPHSPFPLFPVPCSLFQVSYAIAQSSALAVFEGRIERKVCVCVCVCVCMCVCIMCVCVLRTGSLRGAH